MARHKSCQRLIYKLPSSRFRQAGWNLTLPFPSAVKNQEIAALNDSQLLRWIRELNGEENSDQQIHDLQEQIKAIKKLPRSKANSLKIKKLYENLYSLQFQSDYFCMVMNTDQDYDRANQGFSINGRQYRRLLGTNGGIKKSTITYISDRIFDTITARMNNGRDLSKPLIPAKLEAYQALICSSTIPVSMPRIAVVKDCHVTFLEDVIRISDEQDGEPTLTYEKDYEVHYCDSDGYGLMSPDFSRKVNQDLYDREWNGETISGINIRYAWTKGMLFTFDFVEFARRINNNGYQFTDAWGTQRDIRDYDVILTTSMVKLWDSYSSLEHFLNCCKENHYQFSVTKHTPQQLEHTRNFNYQFLQTYELSDHELYELCRPTIEEIKDVLGNDWRKTIVFAKGIHLTDHSVEFLRNDFVKALMIEPRLSKDPYIINKLQTMIKKRIEMAAKGSIQLNGNFAICSGDPYSLAQSIFDLPVTGLLKAGEIYQKYWIDKGVQEVALFRAPMTCHNNIRKRIVQHNPEMDDWYQYNQTGIILNSWDTTCDAANGSDKDGDMFFTTDHSVIIQHTLNSPTIECIQRKAEKIIPSQNDLVEANKLAFGNEIGTITNRITAMIEKQAGFDKDSEEYQTLDYRIKCGQHFQQCAIDKAKGILSKPMPPYWYDRFACQKLPEETEEQQHFKTLCLNIVAENKPYFMKYIYPDLKTKYQNYIKDANSKCIREFQKTLSDLIQKKDQTQAEQEFLEYYQKFMPAGTNPCTVNRTAWLFEAEFPSCKIKPPKDNGFDASILKSGVSYKKKDYEQIAQLKLEYDDSVKQFQQMAARQRLDKEETFVHRELMLQNFKAKCETICSNEKELCDLLIDLCYSSSKSRQFVWDMCADRIIKNLLEKNHYQIHYPVKTESDGEFEFGGEQFMMCKKTIKEDELCRLF